MSTGSELSVSFLFGAPRSGTTWLQNMLGAHPLVATPQESDLFSRYLAPMHEAWRTDTPADPGQWQRRRYKGLPAILTEDEFRAEIARFVERVYRSVLAGKPGARIVLDKAPEYAHRAALAAEYFPDAGFINLIRDGRDVALSIMRASRGWGREWAPGTLEEAARWWRGNVRWAQRMGEVSDRYLELRYEDLQTPSGPSLLQAAFAVVGVDADLDECARIHERFSLRDGPPPSSIVWSGEVMRRLGQRPAEPEGFVGTGRPGAWESRFGAYEHWLFDRVAGDVLGELGYARSSPAPRAELLAPLRLAAEHRLQPVRDGVGRLRRRLLSR